MRIKVISIFLLAIIPLCAYAAFIHYIDNFECSESVRFTEFNTKQISTECRLWSGDHIHGFYFSEIVVANEIHNKQ